MSLNLKPLGSRVVVEPVEENEVTAGGIILPDTAKEKPQKGVVLSVGPGDRDEDGKHIPMDVQVGDTVLFQKYGGTVTADNPPGGGARVTLVLPALPDQETKAAETAPAKMPEQNGGAAT